MNNNRFLLLSLLGIAFCTVPKIVLSMAVVEPPRGGAGEDVAVTVASLHELAQAESAEAMGELQRIVKLSIPSDVINGTNDRGHSPLHTAALHGNKFAYASFVMMGGDWTLRDREGNSPDLLASPRTEEGRWIRAITELLETAVNSVENIGKKREEVVRDVRAVGLGDFDKALKILSEARWLDVRDRDTGEDSDAESVVSIDETNLDELF